MLTLVTLLVVLLIPNTSTVDRIDYSNDTTAMSPKGPLSSARGSMGATGNASFGYFGGGAWSIQVIVNNRSC